jgi:hypothetical protein
MIDAVIRRAPAGRSFRLGQPLRPMSNRTGGRAGLLFWARAPLLLAARDRIVGGAFRPWPL